MKGRLTETHWLLNIPITHRGLFDNEHPENTMPAFEDAIRHGYAIETDVQMTIDGTIFCYHDDNAKRVCNVDKDVRDMTYEEIKTLRPNGKQYPIMTFEEFLNFVNGRTPILIEIKNQKNKGIEQKVVDALKNYSGEVAVQSFNPFIVKRIQKIAPHLLRGVLTIRENAAKVPAPVMWFMRCFGFKLFVKCDFLDENINDLEINKKYSKNYYVITYTVKTDIDVLKAKKHSNNFIFEKTAVDFIK